jgi:hypothetical protein
MSMLLSMYTVVSCVSTVFHAEKTKQKMKIRRGLERAEVKKKERKEDEERVRERESILCPCF